MVLSEAVAFALTFWGIAMFMIFVTADWPWVVKEEKEMELRHQAREKAKVEERHKKFIDLRTEAEAFNQSSKWVDASCTTGAFAETRFEKTASEMEYDAYIDQSRVYRCKLADGKCCNWINDKHGCPDCNIATVRGRP